MFCASHAQGGVGVVKSDAMRGYTGTRLESYGAARSDIGRAMVRVSVVVGGSRVVIAWLTCVCAASRWVRLCAADVVSLEPTPRSGLRVTTLLPMSAAANLSREQFCEFAIGALKAAMAAWAAPGAHSRKGAAPVVAVPLSLRVLSDQLTPVLAYRRLVARDEREAPSFLLESVEGGDRQGRYSILGAGPLEQVIAHGSRGAKGTISIVCADDHSPTLAAHDVTHSASTQDPFEVLRLRSGHIHLCRPPAQGPADPLPACVLGGWFGYAAYDSVRYAPGVRDKLTFADAPNDDRDLPDLHFAFYPGVTVFDHAQKLVYLVQLAFVSVETDLGDAYDVALSQLHSRLADLERHSKPLPTGLLHSVSPGPALQVTSTHTRETHARMIARAKEYIRAGDVFQVVLGQRFETVSPTDPFDVYRALRAVNPSPYMVYMQCSGCILVASSPEILCRVKRDEAGRAIVTNRPLAGTRRRGATAADDRALELELLADEKERAEHIMLVDLGRNDVGMVASAGSVALPAVMEIERYSHVMHISSTVTGALRDGLDCWDALRAALPVGTISGAPKLRAMQIIDELEPVKRGPYGGGFGYIGLDGQMDIALALRTIVVPTALHSGSTWTYHLQASGGIVAGSIADDEFEETVNKSMALRRAIEVAQSAFAPVA
jgi:anthranilate synthase component I